MYIPFTRGGGGASSHGPHLATDVLSIRGKKKKKTPFLTKRGKRAARICTSGRLLEERERILNPFAGEERGGVTQHPRQNKGRFIRKKRGERNRPCCDQRGKFHRLTRSGLSIKKGERGKISLKKEKEENRSRGPGRIVSLFI